jgi:hypothetical protein
MDAYAKLIQRFWRDYLYNKKIIIEEEEEEEIKKISTEKIKKTKFSSKKLNKNNLEGYYMNGKLIKEESKYYQSRGEGGYKGYSWVYLSGNGNIDKKNEKYNKEIKSRIMNENKEIIKGKSYVIENTNSNIQSVSGGYTQTYYIGGGNNNINNNVTQQINQQRSINQIGWKSSLNDNIYIQKDEEKEFMYNFNPNVEEKSKSLSENILISENSEKNLNNESNINPTKKNIFVKQTKKINNSNINFNSYNSNYDNNNLNNNSQYNLEYSQNNLNKGKNNLTNSNSNKNIKTSEYIKNYYNSNSGSASENNNSHYSYKFKSSNIYKEIPKKNEGRYNINTSDNINYNKNNINNNINNNQFQNQYKNPKNNNIYEEYNEITITKKVTNIKNKYENKKK